MPSEKSRETSEIRKPEQKEKREASGWEKMRGIASDVLDLFASDRKLEELIDEKIAKLPPKKRRGAEARQAEMRRRADRERTTAKGLLLSIGLAVSGAAMHSRENPDIPLPKGAETTLTQVEKPKNPAQENWDWLREKQGQESTRKFAEFLKAARQSPDLTFSETASASQTEQESLEETAQEMDMDPEEVEMLAEQTRLDLEKFAAATRLVETVRTQKLGTAEAQRLFDEAVDAFSEKNDVPRDVSKGQLIASVSKVTAPTPEKIGIAPTQPEEIALEQLVTDNWPWEKLKG